MKLLASFVYNGGSNPGTVRSVLIDSVDGDYVTGVDVHNDEPRKYKKELISSGSVKVGELLAEINANKHWSHSDIRNIRVSMGGDTYVPVPERNKLYILKQTDNKGLKLVKPVVTQVEFMRFAHKITIEVNSEKNGLTILVDGTEATTENLLSTIFNKIVLK